MGRVEKLCVWVSPKLFRDIDEARCLILQHKAESYPCYMKEEWDDKASLRAILLVSNEEGWHKPVDCSTSRDKNPFTAWKTAALSVKAHNEPIGRRPRCLSSVVPRCRDWTCEFCVLKL